MKLDSYTFNAYVDLPEDDYVFHMIVVRGRVVSREREKHYVEIIDACRDESNRQLVFKMSVANASLLEQLYPHIKMGLIGQFNLSSDGFLTFVREAPKDDCRKFLLDDASHDFMRSRYCAELCATDPEETRMP